MSTALQKQLNTLRQRPEHDRQLLKSFLFSSADSIQFSREQIHELAVSGVRDLVLVDSRFDAIAKQLLDPKDIRRERGRLSDADAADVDGSVNRALVLLSPHLHMQCAHRFLEYLVRVYEAHEYNALALLTAFLPYHDQGLFVRAIALCDLRGTGFEFLKDNQLKGAVLPRSHLIIACLENPKVLRAVCGLATNSVAEGVVNHAAISLWVAVATAMAKSSADLTVKGAEAAGGGDAAFRVLLPIIVEWLRYSYESPAPMASSGSARREAVGGATQLARGQIAAVASNAALLGLAAWAAEVDFSADVLVLVAQSLVKCLASPRVHAGSPSYCSVAQVTALLFETQSAVADACFTPIVRRLTLLNWTAFAPDVSLHLSAASPSLVSTLIGTGLALRNSDDWAAGLNTVQHWVATSALRDCDVDAVVTAAIEDFFVADVNAKPSVANVELRKIFDAIQRRFTKAFDRVMVAAIERARTMRSSASPADAAAVVEALYRFVVSHLGEGSGGKYEFIQVAVPGDADDDDDTSVGRSSSTTLPLISCLVHPIPTVRKLALQRALSSKAPQPRIVDIVAASLSAERDPANAALHLKLLGKCLQDLAAATPDSLADAAEAVFFAAVHHDSLSAACVDQLHAWSHSGCSVATAYCAAATAIGLMPSKPIPGDRACSAMRDVSQRLSGTSSLPVESIELWAACPRLLQGQVPPAASHVAEALSAAVAKCGRLAASQGSTGKDVATKIDTAAIVRTAALLAVDPTPSSLAALVKLAESASTVQSAGASTAAAAVASAVVVAAERDPAIVGAPIAALLQRIVTLGCAWSALASATSQQAVTRVGWLALTSACAQARVTASGASAAALALTVVELARLAPPNTGLEAAAFLMLPRASELPQATRRNVVSTILESEAARKDVSRAAAHWSLALSDNTAAVSDTKLAAANVTSLSKAVFDDAQAAPSVLAVRVMAFLAAAGEAHAVLPFGMAAARRLLVAHVRPADPPATAADAARATKPARRNTGAAVQSSELAKQRLSADVVALLDEVAKCVIICRHEAAALEIMEAPQCDTVAGGVYLPAFTLLLDFSRGPSPLLAALLANSPSRVVAAFVKLSQRGVPVDPQLLGRAAAAHNAVMMKHLATWAQAVTTAPGAQAAQPRPSGGGPGSSKKTPAASGRSSTGPMAKDDAATNESYAANVSLGDLLSFALQITAAFTDAVVVERDVVARSLCEMVLTAATDIERVTASFPATPDAVNHNEAMEADLASLVRLCAECLAAAGRVSPALPRVVCGSALFVSATQTKDAPLRGGWVLRCLPRMIVSSQLVSLSAAAIGLVAAAVQYASQCPALDVITVVCDTILAAEEARSGIETSGKLLSALLPLLSRGEKAAAGSDDNSDDDVPTVFVSKKDAALATAGKKYSTTGSTNTKAAAAAPVAAAVEITGTDRANSLEALPFAIMALLMRLSAIPAKGSNAVKIRSPRDVVVGLLLSLSSNDRLVCLAGIARLFAKGVFPQDADPATVLPPSCPAELKRLLAGRRDELLDQAPVVLSCVDHVTKDDLFIREFVRDNVHASATSTSRRGLRNRARQLAAALYRGSRATFAVASLAPPAEDEGDDDSKEDKTTENERGSPFFAVVVSTLEWYAAAQSSVHEVAVAALLGRLMTMVDEPTFLMCVRGLITAGEDGMNAAVARMIRLRGFEIFYDRLTVTNDRKASADLSALEHRTAAQLGGAVELSSLAAAVFPDLDGCFRARFSTKDFKKRPHERPSKEDLVELQWIMVTFEELVKLITAGHHTNHVVLNDRWGPALTSTLTAMTKFVMHMTSVSTGITAAVVASQDADRDAAPVADKLTTTLTDSAAVVVCSAIASLGTAARLLGFENIIEHATSLLCAALTALRYASHAQVVASPDGAMLLAMRLRAVAALRDMLPSVWTMAHPWLPSIFDLCSRRLVVDEDAACADEADALVKQLGTLIEPRVIMPALVEAVNRSAPATHSFRVLFALVRDVIERLTRSDIKAMPELMNATLFTAAFEALSRQAQLPSAGTLEPVFASFMTMLVKFKEQACIALVDRVVTWMMRKKPTDPEISKRDVHRWSIGFSALLHVCSNLGSVGVFLFPSITVALVDMIAGCSEQMAKHHDTMVGGESQSVIERERETDRKSARVEGRASRGTAVAEGDDGESRHEAGNREALKFHITAALDTCVGLLRVMSDAVIASTADSVGDAAVAPSELMPYFAKPAVFQSMLPAVSGLLSSTKFLADDRQSYAERCQQSVIPALRRWFLSLRSPKRWSSAQQQLCTLLRHRDAKVRRMVLATLRALYEDGGQELASVIMAEALPQFVETTEDSNDAVVEEARLLCQDLSKLTGQDVLLAMTA